MILSEEEKKKRREEAMQITNRINSNGYNSNDYEDDSSTLNNNYNDTYNQRLQEAMNITNSINPLEITNNEESSIGNIDLNNRPVVENEDGSISTIRSISFEEDGKEVLIPTVIDGKIVSDKEAIEHYHQTGEHLGKFNSVEEANTYAEQLHNQQEELYSNNENKKKKIEIFKGSKAFSDGYQFGDLTKTVTGTLTDTVGNLVSGVVSVGENVIDLGANIVASVQSLIGNKEGAKTTREWANKNYSEKIGNAVANASPIGVLYNAINGSLSWDFANNESFEEGSVLGETSDQVVNLVGYTVGLAVGTKGLGSAGNIGVKVGSKTLNLPTLAVVGGTSGGLSEANAKGDDVTEIERWTKGISSGLIEGVTEGLFGMLGVGGNELTDSIGSKLASKISPTAGKVLVKIGVQSAGESIEEFLSYAGNYIVDNGLINRLGDTDFSSEWDWGEVGEQMALAFVSSALTSGGDLMINQNIATKAAEEQLGRELTQEEKREITRQLVEEEIQEKEFDSQSDGKNIKDYVVASYDENGEVEEIVSTKGTEIKNPNNDININPVAIRDKQSKSYNIIDANTGTLLDTTAYKTIPEAETGFTNMINSLDNVSINNLNQKIAQNTIAINKKIGETMLQKNTLSNQQNNVTEQNNTSSQQVSGQENKIAQNGFSEQTNKTNMEQRNWNNVSDKNVKSYQTENPEVSQEIQEMAYNFQEDLTNSTFGERYKAGDEWTGTKRSTTKELAEIKDDTGASWGKIQKALEDISQGKGDYALAKKVELVLDKALSEGYKNIYGKNIMPNESYLTKKGKIEGKNYLQNETEASTEIESNPEENRIFGERINKKGGNSNARAKKIRNNNSQQEANRTEKGKNTRGEEEISRSNGSSQEKLSKSVQQFQREQQKQLGKGTKISLTEQNKLTKTERTIQKEFENITGLNYGVYESNKGTEDAVYVNDDILVKHNSLQSKKKSNFLPFHELGHWFKVNRSNEWTAIHDIIDNTITKNQIEEYKNVLKDTSMFNNMSEAEIRDYIIEEIESDYFGNWANDISNWANMIRNKMLSDDYVQLLIDISDENISTHYNIFGTQEQQEQVYSQINEMMNNFIIKNKNKLKNDFENNTKQTKNIDFKKEFHNRIQNALINKNSKRRTNFGIVDSKTATKINKITGINVEQRKHILLDNDIRHMINEHSDKIAEAKKKQIPITPKDIELIPDVINEYDRIVKGSDSRGEQTVRYIKNIEKNKVYVVEVVPSQQNDLIIKTMWIKPIRVINSQQTPNLTSKTKPNAGNSTFVNNSIAHKNKSVKSDTATNSNMQKSKNNTIKKSDRIDTNVVATDNQGRQLSKQQQEYFKDTKVRDEDGNLLVMYHGTKDVFTIFKNGKNKYDSGFAGEGFYFTSDYKSAQDYSNWKKGNDNFVPKVMSVYIDAKKPLIIGDFSNGIKTAVGEKLGIEFKTKNPLAITKEDSQKITETLIKKGYDSVIFKAANNPTEQIVMVINSNQIKNVDNKKPTDNPDIRYSNRADMDSEGRELSKEQQEFFKDVSSDFKDKNNNILELHHVTDRDFNIFDPNMFGKNTGEKLNGIYMSTEPIGVYGDRDIKVYANVKNPVKSGLKNITKKQYIELLKGHATDSNIENSWHYFKNSDDLTILEKIKSLYKSNRNYKNPQEFFNNVMKITGYDGAIYENYANNRKAYVAFNSNQVKRIDNKKPTNNPDIRYSNRYDTEENGEGGFYSQLEKVIEEKMPNTSNAQQIKGIIENSGIKQDEIKWIGLDDYLKKHSLEKISKQQLQDYIKANQINIETVQKGTNKLDEYTEPVKQDIASKNIDIQYILDKYGFDYERDDLIPYKLNGLRAGTVGDFMAENLEKYIDLNDFDKYEKQEDGSFIRTYRDSDGIQWTTQFTEKDFKEDMQKLEDLYDQRTQAEMELSSIEDEYGDYADEIGVPKYKQYSLKGGTNYQEILYTLPLNNQNQNEILKLSGEIAELRAKAYLSDPVLATDEERIESNRIYAEINKRQEQLDRLEKLDNVTYKSPHWEEKNVLAHARTQDFEDISGNKVLFIDEIQSDLHQQGRSEGYETKEITKRRAELRNEREKIKENEINYENELRELRNKGYNNAKELYIKKQNKAMKQSSLLEEKYNIQNNLTNKQQYELLDYEDSIIAHFSSQVRESRIFRDNIDNNKYMIEQVKEAEKNLNIKLSKDILSKQKNRDIYRRHAIEQFRIGYYDYMNVRHSNMYLGNNDQYLSEAEQSRIYELDKLMKENEDKGISINLELDKLKPKISDVFPFKKNWHEFVLRRMINNAVEQGYDEVAWTTGRQQRERYNLSKVIDSIEYEKLYYHPDNVDKGKVDLVDIFAQKNGDTVFSRAIKSEELANYIGKDLAERILNSKEGKGTISNLDEEIRENGNSGMYVFYDQEIPNYLNKYLKKWNSKVEEITLMDADGKTESKQMGFKITDKMRNSIKQNGQPLFSNRQLDEEEASTYDEKIQRKNRELIKELRKQKETIRKEDPNVAPGATNAQGANRFIEQEIRKIEASGNWDNSIPVTRLTDIRKTIEDYLGLGIKKGHFRERAYGIYKEGRDVIRGKELKDIDNILHETGHALDLGNRLKIDKESIANELLTAIQKHGGYENETRSTKLDEGFAEVIRTYSIIPEQAKADYPQSVAVLEEIRRADKSFDDFITKVQQQTYNYIHQNPQNRVHSNISVGESNRTPLTKAWLEQEVMRNIWDKDYAVKKVVSEIAKIGGKTTNQIKASNNAYYLTRLATGIHDKVTSMLSDGYINEKGEKIMPGLNKIGEILGDDAQRYNDLRDYLVAKRDTDYKAKTLKTGIRDMDTKYVLEKFANDRQIKDAAQVVYDTLDGVMQYAVDNGLISQDDVKKLKESNAFYVPMQRVIEGKGNQLGRKGAVSDIIKTRTGSELDIKDILENIVANSSNIIQQVENNNVLRALYSQGEEVGLTGAIYDVIDAPMIKVGTANLSMWENELKKQGVNTTNLDLEKTIDIFAPNKKVDAQNLITSFIDESGKRVYLQFNDEILFNSLMNMDKKFMSQVLQINSKLNMPLRYGATMANIGFAIPNMISDTAQAAVFSNAGFVPVIDNALGVLDVLTATNEHVKKFVKNYSPEYVARIENMYNIWKQTGSTSSTRMSQYRESTQSIMKDIYGTKKSETLGIHEKWKPLKRLLDLMTYIPEISEQSTRFRVFEKNYDMYKTKGNSEMDSRILAALESRDATQDFGRTGNLTREINQLIPFSAARVGSGYTFAEKVKANPKQTAMRIAVLTAIGLAIKAIGYKDKEIEELNQRKKDDNFILKIGDHIVTIKKPQGILRSMLNLGEYIEDLATGHIEDGKEKERLGEWINNAIMDNMPADSVTGLVPNMVAPLIENAINKDFYYNTDIVKSWDLELPDSQQYYEYNSQLAILLGRAFNYSPAKIDNLISGYFAGLGTQVTGIMDYLSGKMGITAQKAEMGAESNAVGRRFIVNVNSNSSSLDEVYNLKTELTKKKNGGTITEEETEKLEKITAAISTISKVNKQIKEIKKDLTMSGKEKAEQIKVLQEQRTDIARQALGKDLINTDESTIVTTSFYPTVSTLSLNNYKLELTSEMKKEYTDLASTFYKKYESQGLYNEEALEKIKSKAKEYAKKTLMQKYKSQLTKSK